MAHQRLLTMKKRAKTKDLLTPSKRFGPRIKCFSTHPWHNWIAHRSSEPRVAGSNPAGCTFFDLRTDAATPVRSEYFTGLRQFDREKRLIFKGFVWSRVSRGYRSAASVQLFLGGNLAQTTETIALSPPRGVISSFAVCFGSSEPNMKQQLRVNSNWRSVSKTITSIFELRLSIA